jgi:hypothetical protein
MIFCLDGMHYTMLFTLPQMRFKQYAGGTGAGSTPLHYVAGGGSQECCEVN